MWTRDWKWVIINHQKKTLEHISNIQSIGPSLTRISCGRLMQIWRLHEVATSCGVICGSIRKDHVFWKRRFVAICRINRNEGHCDGYLVSFTKSVQWKIMIWMVFLQEDISFIIIIIVKEKWQWCVDENSYAVNKSNLLHFVLARSQNIHHVFTYLT